jgi:hypothetical protein
MRYIFFIVALVLQLQVFSQTSIHMEETEKYAAYGSVPAEEYDRINGFYLMDRKAEARGDLLKTVFGYHPYWGGSNYLNYQWDLLSDLCYFSYEVDPATGNPDTYHDWLTSPAIDSAFANGTRVHLCVTLFSGHSTFFNSPAARQNLTNNLIDLLRQRGARGVSFDFEAVPSSQGDNMLDYIGEFHQAFSDSIPQGILSMAIPAVDWSGIFDVSVLNQYIDLYMIMGYDYYWNGSSQAGPVDPLYSMTPGYNYNVSRTISYYQSEGMPPDRMLLGVPYYAREWPTASGTAPSATTGSGKAYTYANIKNNVSGHYSPANKHWESNSFSPYFSYEDNGWYQCFVNDTRSLSNSYKLVNRRGLAGIGIWALGYDNGYTELWELINSSFSTGSQMSLPDTLYDSGGPSWYYYDDENYVLSCHRQGEASLRLEFLAFGLEAGYDSLWVYDGEYPGGMLLGGYSGNSLPPALYADSVLSIRFYSDHNTTASGWMAIVEDHIISVDEHNSSPDGELAIYPNPASSWLNIQTSLPGEMSIYDLHGRKCMELSLRAAQTRADISTLPGGIYILRISQGNEQLQKKFIKQ